MSLLSDMFPDKVTAGSTAQKNAIAPKLNQKFFDTALGKEQQWDGTVWKDVVPAATYTPPPAAGPVGGTVSATHWRMVVTKGVPMSPAGKKFSVWMFYDFLFSDAACTIPLIDPKVVSMEPGRNFAGSPMFGPPPLHQAALPVLDVKTGTTKSELVFGIEGAVPTVYTQVFNTPVSPTSVFGRTKREIEIPGVSNLVDSFHIDYSLDGGVSWVTIQSVGAGKNSSPILLSTLGATNTYPANPVDGQRFLNTTTGINMHWSATDSKWLPDPKFNKWITLSAASVVSMDNPNMLVDTTAAALTITLPPIPKYGSSVMLADAKGTWVTNACIVVPSPGNTLMGGTVGIVLTTTSTIVWNGTDWRIV